MDNEKRKALSRRHFVQSSLGATVVLANGSLPASEDSAVKKTHEQDSLEAALAKHGSEFGNLRRAR